MLLNVLNGSAPSNSTTGVPFSVVKDFPCAVLEGVGDGSPDGGGLVVIEIAVANCVYG